MKTLFYFLMLIFVGCTFTSCWTTYTTYTPPEDLSAQYDCLRGETKNQILQVMGVPDRTLSDGAGGEILRYEQRKYIVSSSSKSSSSSYSSSSATAGYNYFGNATAHGSGYSDTYDKYSSTTTSQEQINFVEAFINKQGVCYRVRANVWSDAQKGCCRKADPAICWWILYPPVGIPCLIWYFCNCKKVKPCH